MISSDRLLFTLLFSIIIHLVIVLGVSFEVTSPFTNQPFESLDITLVKQQTELAPEEADFLAQANNEGGGETQAKSAEPSPTPISPDEIKESAADNAAAPSLPPVKAVVPTPPSPPAAKKETVTPPQPKVKTDTSPSKAIVQAEAERIVHQALEEAKQRQQEQATPAEETPPRRTLILPTQADIAKLDRQFDAISQALSKTPKKRYISSSTREYAAAAYMQAWQMKVERIGNFNYPQEAKRKGLNGSLMLTVDINPDGSVSPNGIVVSKPSPYKILDDAAVRIVRLGAPYAAVPDNVLQGNDVLTIIRTWKFETNGLSTR
ncbi:MAG: energy transducer TonB [Gammaproteobacteria bacterium]|nr:MAG: energy transducer TonB [Gammaproteobacteria bacterium]